MKHLLWCVILAVGLLEAPPLLAQGFGPRPGMGGQGGGGGQEKKSDKEGPAEAAPEEKEGEPELPAMPAWPGQEAKKFQVFQMQGYFRFRWYMHQNLNLGMRLVPFNVPGGYLVPPFYTPISEDPSSPST